MRLLLAGNHREAVYCLARLREKGQDTSDVRIVNDPLQLRGTERGTTFMTYGTYYERNDWPEFEAVARMRRFDRVWL